MSSKISPMLIKWRKNICDAREFRYDTIYSQNFVSIGLLVWKLLGGGPKFYTDTHTHTHTHTHRHTHTHTQTHTHRLPILRLFFFFKKETRLKRHLKGIKHLLIGQQNNRLQKHLEISFTKTVSQPITLQNKNCSNVQYIARQKRSVGRPRSRWSQ